MGISVKGSLSIILTVLPDCTLGHFIPIIMTTHYMWAPGGGGGGGALSIYTGGGVPQHIQKGGVLGTGTTQKRGVLGTGTTQKRGVKARARVEKRGLRHGHESKKG